MKSLIVYLSLCYIFYFPLPAYAYLDPGTGSMLVSALVGIVATLFFLIKGIYYRGTGVFYEILGKTRKNKKKSIVFYSEGKTYWNVFRPIIDALAQKDEECVYLTSDKNDPALQYTTKGLTAQYIGTGNKAYSTMNMLEADICVMTTPGLDVLQIRRSPGVKHYAHIVHAAGEVSLYRMYGCDYYDSVFTSGKHQELSLRELERQRGTQAKEIYQSGCAYFDVLMRMKQESDTQFKNNEQREITVLVAPTWGVNGLLSRYGVQLLEPLAQAGYKLIVRPHPQSYIAEPEMLEQIKTQMAIYPHIIWDNSANNFSSMSQADVLISDYSSIILDFAFVMERPALTMEFTPNIEMYDAYDIAEEPWDFQIHPKLGKRITMEDVPHLPQTLKTILADTEFTSKIQTLRSESVYNFGHAGTVIAEQLCAIKTQLNAQNKKK